MAKPSGVRIRAYNVGFGDCFLLSVDYASSAPRHLLVDFGTTKLPSRGGPASLEDVAKRIKADCGGKLDVVVATHRHSDHISGFAGASGKIIASLNPDLVIQPWTENPDIAPDAQAPPRAARGHARRVAAVTRLAEMHEVAEVVRQAAPRLAATPGVPKTVAAQLAFLGEDNISNPDAVRTLQAMGKKHLYASFGTSVPSRLLPPGVRIEVLGPPTLEQSSAIRKEARRDPDEYWHLAVKTARASTSQGGKPLFPKAATKAKPYPQEVRWLIPHIERVNAEELLAIVRILDDVLNNTSLILLIQVGDYLLLFPGDAQIENWRYALTESDDAAAVRARIAGAHVYKVGHHGSLNATPKTSLWELFTRRSEQAGPDRLITVMSTLGGKHGAASRGTEVPRKNLVDELTKRSTLYTTQEKTTASQFWRDVTLPPPP